MSDEAFAAYVDGRTIALVGPAPFANGDVERIYSHDLIYLIGDSPWDGPVDIRFANVHVTREYRRAKRELPKVDWLVCKGSPEGLPYARRAHYPKHLNVNQVTGAICDLDHFTPADVNVYGADLYIGGFEKQYRPGYGLAPEHKQYNGIISHRPKGQHETARDIMLRRGWFSGSTTYLAALELETDEYIDELKRVWNRHYASEGWTAK